MAGEPRAPAWQVSPRWSRQFRAAEEEKEGPRPAPPSVYWGCLRPSRASGSRLAQMYCHIMQGIAVSCRAGRDLHRRICIRALWAAHPVVRGPEAPRSVPLPRRCESLVLWHEIRHGRSHGVVCFVSREDVSSAPWGSGTVPRSSVPQSQGRRTHKGLALDVMEAL